MMRVGEHREDLVQRVRVLRGALAVLLCAVAGSFWFTQLVRGDYYRELAENNRLRKLPVRAPRGLIYDRLGRPLVENVPSYNLLLDRSRTRDVEKSLAYAAGVLGREPRALDEVLARYRETPSFAPVLVAENLTLAQVARFGVESLEHPEFEVSVEHQRLYRHAAQTAPVLGYLGEVTAGELQRGGGAYQAGELIGKKGVEQTYDERLRGRQGERVVVVDSRGRLLEESLGAAAVPGESLTLTLDLDVQQRAERALGDEVGAVVALDPRSGEIVALASSPSFNPNLFARRLQPEDWQAILTNPFHPLQNRAIQNTYSPGSIFKIVVALAGLGQGLVGPEDGVFCSGVSSFYNHQFRCWRRGGHGWVNMRNALRESCDIYFYTLGQKLGVDTIARYARSLGLGSETGIDLSGERPGLVPDVEWSARVRRHPWYPGETISVSIGQGPLLATPLQIAVLMSAIANGGELVTPHLLRGAKVPPPRRVPLSADQLARVREALWAVVNETGTGARARLEGFDVAGKTSTVQVIAQKTWTRSEDLPFEQRDHGWFASFAPYHAPELVVVVFIEHGGHGSDAAAPVAREVYETYFRDHLPADRVAP
jgi:penicillin-binding protein 2